MHVDYEKTNWINNETTLSQDNLNHIETGIKDCANAIDGVETEIADFSQEVNQKFSKVISSSVRILEVSDYTTLEDIYLEVEDKTCVIHYKGNYYIGNVYVAMYRRLFFEFENTRGVERRTNFNVGLEPAYYLTTLEEIFTSTAYLHDYALEKYVDETFIKNENIDSYIDAHNLLKVDTSMISDIEYSDDITKFNISLPEFKYISQIVDTSDKNGNKGGILLLEQQSGYLGWATPVITNSDEDTTYYTDVVDSFTYGYTNAAKIHIRIPVSHADINDIVSYFNTNIKAKLDDLYIPGKITFNM